MNRPSCLTPVVYRTNKNKDEGRNVLMKDNDPIDPDKVWFLCWLEKPGKESSTYFDPQLEEFDES